MIKDRQKLTLGLSKALSKHVQPESAKHIASRIFSAMIVGQGSYTPSRWNKRLIVEQAYERNLPFHFAVNLIAQTVASIPLVVECGVRGKRQRTDTHPMLKALARNMDIYDLLERLTKNYVVLGETHALIVKSDLNKKPLGTIVMPEVNVKNIEGTWRRPIAGFEYSDKGRVERFDYDDVIHIYKPSLSNYFEAMPVAIPAQDTISLNNAGITWNKNVAQSGGMPPVIAQMSGANEKVAREFKKMWGEQSGAANAADIKVTPDNVEFKQFNVTPHDAEWERAVLASLRFILMSLNVSSTMANDAGNKTYNNVKDARKALYTEAGIPVAKRIVSAINRKMSPYYEDDPILLVDEDGIEAIQEDKAKQWSRIIQGIDAGLITQNEGRDEIGKQPGKGPTADLLQNSRIINNIPKVNGTGDTPNPDNQNEQDTDDGQED